MGIIDIRPLIVFFKKVKEDDVIGLGAQLAFFFLLSLFPLLIFLVTLLPYLPLTQDDLLGIIADFAPGDTISFIETNLNDIMGRQNRTLLSFGIIATLWAASNGMNGIARALNKAYNVKESRSFIVQRGMAIVFTVAMIFVFLIALLLPVFGKLLGVYLFSKFGLSSEFLSIWNTLRWLISTLIIFIVFLILYWLVPNKKFKCSDAAPGAIFATVGWLAVSFGFSFYVNNFGNYSMMYGSIGAVIVLLIWFYLSGIILILGGEINALVSSRKNKRC